MKMILQIATLGLTLAWAQASRAQPYNEITDGEGKTRSTYTIPDKNGTFPHAVTQSAFDHLMGRPMDDAIKILPIPLVLSGAEYQLLQAGAEQRANTVVKFFEDVAKTGGQKAIAAGIISDPQIEALFKTDGFIGRDRIKEIYGGESLAKASFLYGADVVRNEQGKFVVLEDNIGPLGGIADVDQNHIAMEKVRASNESHRSSFLKSVIENYLKDIPREEWSRSVLAIYREDLKEKENHKDVNLNDDEDRRNAKILLDLGIRIVQHDDFGRSHVEAMERGEITKIVNFSDPLTWESKNWSHIDKLIKLFAAGKIQFMFSPGLDGVSNKALLPFFDQLTKLYLGADPILPTQYTELVDSMEKIDVDDDQWVYKMVNGSQGSEVYPLRYLNSRGRIGLKNYLVDYLGWSNTKFNDKRTYFVRQRFVDQSYIPAQIPDSWVKFNVDVRPLTHVLNGQVDVAPMLWGRTDFKLSGRLVNVSRGAMELVVTTPGGCAQYLGPRANR